MAERIAIHFKRREDGGQEVGIHYHPETSEWLPRDEMLAEETALHALAAHAIQQRQQQGMPVPEVLYLLVQAYTFHELF